MKKLDSFLKESQRFNGSDICTHNYSSKYICHLITGHKTVAMLRKSMVDVRLYDGTVVPAGTLIATSQYAVHHDGRHYKGADIFDPSRWENGQESDERNQFASTSQVFLGWGHGKYAWYVVPEAQLEMIVNVPLCSPGRFYAAAVLKATLGYIVLNYDIKFQDGTRRPQNVFWGSTIRAPDVDVLFRYRKRQAVNVV